MEARLQPCLALPLNEEELNKVTDKAKDWAIMHGVGMRSKTNFSPDSLNFAPFVLLPSVFPRKEFERAVALQPTINELMHKVAHDHEFLEETLKNTIKVDEFTNRLFKLYDVVRKEGYGQQLSLGLVRLDLMLEPVVDHFGSPPSLFTLKQVECNTIASGFGWLGPASGLIHSDGSEFLCTREDKTVFLCLGEICVSLGLLRSDYLSQSFQENCIKQVEVNTIASSFGGIATQIFQSHRYILQELGHSEMLKNLPENNALQGLCSGMLEAWKIFGNQKAVIMFVVEDVTYNICDQRFHEFEIRRMNPDVRVIRHTLTEIGQTGKVGSNKELLIGREVVAVAYFRAGYEPGHYMSEREWDAQLLLERSSAIKCPSIHYHLAGTKKVQQALAKPGCLERFLCDSKQIEDVRSIFTGLYSLDFDESGNIGVEKALSSPSKYVLKPQREGGGNNVYGENIKTAMLAMKDSEERLGWILMDRILPPVQANYIVRPGQAVSTPQDIVCELGVFGVVIGDDKNIQVNRQVGHMLRSKLSSADEGGVAAGSGALDSPYLV